MNDETSDLVRIALRGTGPEDERIVEGVEFSLSLPLDEADGLLHFCALGEDILTYPGPKAWHQDEPITMSHFRTPLSRKARRVLGEEGFFHHTNPNPEWRVLSPTHGGSLEPVRDMPRENSAVAAVNNYGGRFWWVFRGNRFRNRFILDPRVKLFGSRASWEKFKRWPWSRPGPPPNYMGEANTVWYNDSQVRFLAQFKVAVCLENTLDSPHYFTEKFVNAARAGCIPVFHAVPSIKEARLKGALWVDPASFGFDPQRTISFALEQPVERYQEANDEWLKSSSLAQTHRDQMWVRIAQLMKKKVLAEREHRDRKRS